MTTACDILREKMQVLADTELVPYRRPSGARVGVSSHLQKAVMLVLLAYEGEIISLTGISARACCSIFAAHYAVEALIVQGLVIAHKADKKGQRRFTVSIQRLLELQTTEGLCSKGGVGPDTKRRQQYRRSYHRKQKLAKHLAATAAALKEPS